MIIITGHSIHAVGYSNRVLFLICGYSCFNAVTLKSVRKTSDSHIFTTPAHFACIDRIHQFHYICFERPASSAHSIGHFCLVYEMREVFAVWCHSIQYSILNGIVCLFGLTNSYSWRLLSVVIICADTNIYTGK